MDPSPRPQPQPRRFDRVTPRPVNVANLVNPSFPASGERFPRILQPAVGDVDLVAWARDHREYLEQELTTYGALLFRGFTTSLTSFEQLTEALCSDLMRGYGDLPRAPGTRGVYHATPYPSDERILWHNESSHWRVWPRKQFFMSLTVAAQGGETCLADCRKVYQLLGPPIRDRFHRKQLLYVRNFTPHMDVDWRTFFGTSDRSVVEARCREVATQFEWKTQDRLQTRALVPAVIRHPGTGEMSFFNQLQLHHPSCLPPGYRDSADSSFEEEDLPRNVFYGDGSPIEDEVLGIVGETLDRASFEHTWQAGDIVMVDNMLVAHSRKAYSGPRKIVVALGELTRASDITD